LSEISLIVDFVLILRKMSRLNLSMGLLSADANCYVGDMGRDFDFTHRLGGRESTEKL
jgi:hypothetical protein